jgi:hypothetical protein
MMMYEAIEVLAPFEKDTVSLLQNVNMLKSISPLVAQRPHQSCQYQF